MDKLKGIALSEGIAIADLVLIEETDLLKHIKPMTSVNEEVALFEYALELTEKQIKNIHHKAHHDLGEETADIFHAHMLIAKDPEIHVAVVQKIKTFGLSAYEAYDQTMTQYMHIFQQVNDDYLKERMADVEDVALRIKKNILKMPIVDLLTLEKPTILALKDLVPSQLAQFNPKVILGVITEIGGKTSHSTIIAHLMGIPVVTGIKVRSLKGKQAIIDGFSGDVIIDPDQATCALYQKKIQDHLKDLDVLKQMIGTKSVSKDHIPIQLEANISSSNDIDYVIENDADGIGLFRTEFLFINKKQMPTESEQFEHYKRILELMKDKPVIMRTLDVGGDKILPYLNISRELNPFLGKRAIRLCFDHPELFNIQLRALLRASHYGQMKIMFPMIATKEEFIKAKAMVNQVMADLDKDHVPYNKDIEIGIMIEIPSSALMADDLAKVVDFFSIGTNDLIQYTMAADRMHPELAYLYQPFHPVILKLIKMVTDAAKIHRIPVGVCGEMASDMQAIPLLLGLGVNALSMSPSHILKARKCLQSSSIKTLEKIADKALQCDNQQCVLDLLS
ncbi:MAG: phosphoenolpyruvate--protein phosphotransferase [Acholeplasmataceae bacterium]